MFSSVALNVLFAIGLVIVFFFLLFFLVKLTTGRLVSRVIRGRKIFIGHNGSYEMVVDFLSFYFAGLGAIITDDSTKAEFQLILSPDKSDPEVIACRLSDKYGFVKTLRECEDYWPEPLAMAFANFIMTSG